MRIISGRLRGRKLKGPRGRDVRPTSDRLKETLFDIIGPDISDSVVLDGFAGTGAIGLEALSRGAGEVVFIERDPEGSRLIRQNLNRCAVETGYRIIRHDIFTALRSLGREGFKSDIVFLDPPYDWKPYADLLDIIFKQALVRSGSLAVVEHYRKSALPEAGEQYRRVRVVCQGDHRLSFYRQITGS